MGWTIFAILLIGYVNLIRYTELKEYTTVLTFSDYLKFNNYVYIGYNITLILLFVAAYKLLG